MRANLLAAMAITLSASAALGAPNFSTSSKSVDKTSALPGDTLTYAVKMISTGDAANITVQDTLPPGVTYVPGSTTWSAPGLPFINIIVLDQNGQSGLAAGFAIPIPLPTNVPFLGTIREIDFTLRATVNAAATGMICNSATITGGGASTNVTTNPCSTVPAPQLATPELTVKINGGASVSSPHTASPGDALQYTLVLANTGSVSATNLHLHVDAPPFATNFSLVTQGDANATVVQQSSGGANGTGFFDLTNLTVPANFQLQILWQATAFTAAQFQAVGITAAQIDGKQLPEQAQEIVGAATNLSDDPSTSASTDPTTVVMKFGTRPDFSGFIKSLAGSESRSPGDTLVYTLTVPNDGTANANNVRLDDTVDSRLTFVSAVATNGGNVSFGNGSLFVSWPNPLAPGATDSVTLTVKLPASIANGTQVSNQAYASSSEIVMPMPSDDPSTPASLDPTVVTIQSAPDLSGITKTVAASPNNPVHSTPGIHPGDTVTYTITVPNTGTQDASGLVVTDVVDPRLTPVLPISNGGTFSGGTVRWSPAQPLPANGAPLIFTFDAVVAKPLVNNTVIANQANVAAQGTSAVLSDDPSTSAPHDSTKFSVVSAPDLSTSTKAVTNLTHTDGTFHAGDRLQYTITPVNTGDAATSATVISDVLDSRLTFVSATQNGTFDATSRTIAWSVGGTPIGTGTAVSFIATIARPIVDGSTIGNFATLTAPELPAAGTRTNTVTITVHSAPDLSGITKTVSANNAPIVAAVPPGTVLTYTIKVTNNGDANATSVVISDPVDANLDNVTPQDGGTLSGTTVTWSLGGLVVGSSFAVHFTGRVKALTANGTVISNQASVTSTEIPLAQPSDDPSTGAAHDPTLVTVNAKPDLSTSTKAVAVQSQVAPGVLRPGDSLRYTLTIINTGNGFADNVVVKDTLDADLVTPLIDQGGNFANGTITWNAQTTPALAHVAPGVANAVKLTFSATVAATAHDGDVISNQGLISSDEIGGFVTDDPGTAAAKDATRITVHFPVLTLKKALAAETPRADGTLHPGDFVDYTITIANTGSLAATNVTVADPIDANLDNVSAGQGGAITVSGTTLRVNWNSTTTPMLASVAGGTSVQLTLRARIKPGTANATIVSNQATLRATELLQSLLSDDPSTAAANDPTRFSVHAQANLATSTKTVTSITRGGNIWHPGDSVAYVIAVKNTGDAAASHLVVQDPLDAALTLVVAPQGNVANGQIIWSTNTDAALASVAAGTEVDLTFTAVISNAATDQEIVANQGSISFDELNGATPQSTDDPTTSTPGDATKFKVTAGPHLAKSIKTVTDLTSSSGVVHPGDTLEYEIHVLNDGSLPSTNTVLLDPPPSQTTYVAGSTTLNGAAVADVGGVSPLTAGLRVHSARAGTADGTVLISMGAMPDDTVSTVTFKVLVSAIAVPGTQIANQGMLRADKVPQAVTDDPTTPAVGDATLVVIGNSSLLTAEKTWSLSNDLAGNGSADVGDTIQYRIEVDNRGAVAATSVAIEDDLPAGATYVAGSLALNGAALTDASDNDSGSVVGTRVHVAIGALGAGKNAIVTFRMQVNQQGVLSNQAQVNASGGVSINSDGDPSLPGIQPTLTPVGAGNRVDFSGSAKSVLDENGGDVQPGDALTYTITLVNSGGIDATQAIVDDPLPPGLQYIANSATGDGTIVFTPAGNTPGLITSSGITVRAGGRAQIQFRARVLSTVGIGASIRNEAGVRVGPGQARLALPVVVIIGQAQGSSAVTGKVAWDLNGDGVVGSSDRPLPGYQVLIRRGDVNSGAPVKTMITDTAGNFRASDLPPAAYVFEVVSPNGVHFADATAALGGASGTFSQLDIAVQPMGALVRADRTVIAGAKVVLLYDDSEAGNAPPVCETDRSPIAIGPQILAEGKTLPRAVSPGCLRTGQQGQITGSDGLYRFDILDGTTTSRSHAGTPRKYRLLVLPETPNLTFPGTKPGPTPGFTPAGPVIPQGDPSVVQGALWFQRFSLAPGDTVTNNHVELDSSSMHLTKIAMRSTAMIGDLVGYVVTLQNPGSQDLLVDSAGNGGVHLDDVLPSGLRYAAGSARADRLVPSGAASSNAGGVQPAAVRHCPLVAQDSQGTNCAGAKQGPRLPESGKAGQNTVGANLDFGPYDLPAGQTLELRYQAVVLTSARPGDAINSAVARSGSVNISNSDSAIVRIAQDPLFDLSSLIGKVYCETDAKPGADHRQEKGEMGVPGVRIYEDEGWFAESDSSGKFHFIGLQPGFHRFKIDVRTLPSGDEPLDDGAVSMNLTAGLDARANFAITCHRELVGPDRVALKIAAPLPQAARQLTVDPAALEVRVDGVQLQISRGALRLLPGVRRAREDLIEAKRDGTRGPIRFQTLISGGPIPLEWRATLTDIAGGSIGEVSGPGAPPDEFEIAPQTRMPIGATVRAQLELKSADGSYVSPFLALRVVREQPPDEITDSFLLRGTFFDEQSAAPTPELATSLATAIETAKAKPGLSVDIAVHTAGAGSPDVERALSEERARAIRDQMIAAGIASERIRASGHGSDVPLLINVTEKARLFNRRVLIQLLKPPQQPPAPDALHVDALVLMDAKPLSVPPGQPVGELPIGQTAAFSLQRPDGAHAELRVPAQPLFAPPPPVPVHLDLVTRTLSVGGYVLAMPLLGLTVQPLVDDAPSRRLVLDSGSVPHALAFQLRAPVDGVVSWRLSVESPEGEKGIELTGVGAPPRRLEWPIGKALPAGTLRARLSVKTRNGSEGRSPLAEMWAAPPALPVISETDPASNFFAARGRKLSAEGAKAAKAIADKLFTAAGPGGRLEADVFSDEEPDAPQVTEARAADLAKALARAGVPAAQLVIRPRGALLPVAPNTNAANRKANNRIVFAAMAAEKPLSEAEPMPASARAGDAVLRPDGVNFTGSLTTVPQRLPLDLRLMSGAGAAAQLELPFAAAPATAPGFVSSARVAEAPAAQAMVVTPGNSIVSLGSKSTEVSGSAPAPTAAPAPPPLPDAPIFLPEELPMLGSSGSPVAAPVDAGTPAQPVPANALPNAASAQPPVVLAPGSPTAAVAPGPQAVGTPTVGTATDLKPPPPNMATVQIADLPPAQLPLAAKVTADLPASGTNLRAEALWVRGSTDPRNKITLNGANVKVDSAGNFAGRATLLRGDQTVLLVSTDPNGETATIERKVHVDPDGLFLLLLGEGDFGQGGAQLDGVGDRTDFGGLFLKGRASGVIEGRWDPSAKTHGFFKDLQLSGNFDTARQIAPDAFVEFYDPSRYYPVDGDSGLFGQQAASQGPVYLNFKADQSHLIVGNFKTQATQPTEQLFRFDRTLYGIDLNLERSFAVAGAGKPGLDSKIEIFGAEGDLRQHHSHGELRGTGGSIYYLKDSDLIEGSEQVRLVVRDANTGLELTSVPLTRDVDYTLQSAEGRVVFKQAVPSVADASFLANANYTTALGGHPVFVVLDYDYRGSVGSGGHAGGAHIQETLFGIVTAGAGLASENYSGGAAYTLGGINLGIKPKPHTFLNVEVAKSNGTDSEAYTSVDGGLTFGSLAPTCISSTTTAAACNSAGRAFRIEASFELADWVDRKSTTVDKQGGVPTVGTSLAPPLPMPSGMSNSPNVGPGDWVRANAYFDTRDQGFYSSGGDMDKGATKAGFLLRWTPDARTVITGRIDQVASDVALTYDDAVGYTTKRVLRRFSGIQAVRTLGEPGTFGGRFTLTGELDDTYTDDSILGSTYADTIVAGVIFRATPKLNVSLYQQGIWNADASQYPTAGDRLSTTLGASYKLNDKLYADLAETLLWSGNNSTLIGIHSPLFSPNSSVYANERFNLTGGALQSTTVLGAEEKIAAGARMYGEYQLDNQASATNQRAVLGLANKWEVRPGLFAQVSFERAQVLGGIGAELGGGFTGNGSNIPGAAPGATLGGIVGQSPIAGTSLNPVANCGTTTATSGTPLSGQSGACSSSSLGFNPAGAYYPGTTNRNSGSVSFEYLGSDLFKMSAKGELRLDNADQRLVGLIAGVADRLHYLVAIDASSKWRSDLGAFARVHLAQTQAQNVLVPTGPQITEARWVEMTAGVTYRPVETDWVAVMFKATHLIDLRPLNLSAGIGDEQTSDILAISPTFELPFHIAIAEKLAYKHTRDVLADGPALDTSFWLWINRVDLHLHKMFDFSAEFRMLALRGPSSGAVGIGGDGERGILLEAAFKPSKYARVGLGWNFTTFSDDELARYDHSAGGFFIRAVGEY